MLTSKTLIRLGGRVFAGRTCQFVCFIMKAAHIMLLNIYYPAVSPDLFEAYLIAVDIAAKYAKRILTEIKSKTRETPIGLTKL